MSRAISQALRHDPSRYDVAPDAHGWVTLDALIAGLRRNGWPALTRADVERVTQLATKRRHEIVEGRIRAIYGHSFDTKVPRASATPPKFLFHGTSPEAATQIERAGLLPMERQYVHLATSPEAALEVGRRKSKTPRLVVVEAQVASAAGISFYPAGDLWLSNEIPSRFLSSPTFPPLSRDD